MGIALSESVKTPRQPEPEGHMGIALSESVKTPRQSETGSASGSRYGLRRKILLEFSWLQILSSERESKLTITRQKKHLYFGQKYCRLMSKSS
jgi:hypothetical protein